jgi:hypothetical protein
VGCQAADVSPSVALEVPPDPALGFSVITASLGGTVGCVSSDGDGLAATTGEAVGEEVGFGMGCFVGGSLAAMDWLGGSVTLEVCVGGRPVGNWVVPSTGAGTALGPAVVLLFDAVSDGRGCPVGTTETAGVVVVAVAVAFGSIGAAVGTSDALVGSCNGLAPCRAPVGAGVVVVFVVVFVASVAFVVPLVPPGIKASASTRLASLTSGVPMLPV